ncbi:Uncharacterized protein DPV78_012095 [Talaromyces pinophilus]|jgi:acyl-coenzyme A thioesterase PaaI-like protein|nr:Uncharacterized protein DPV78_012095 [Talaromyces pinophilus]
MTTDLEARLGATATASPAMQRLLSSQDCKQFRGVLAIAPENQANQLTFTTLAGPGKISCPPYVATSNEMGELLAFYHLGSQLAGHAGICHGGLSAVLLDECMGRVCFARFANGVGVTVKLDISYRAPIPVDSVVMVAAKVEKVEGRKAWVKATIQDPEESTVFVEAEAMFIEPKWAAEMSNTLQK